MTTSKTYTTAAVIIPPDESWEPIQKLRRVHDRNYRRWMPHITLLYPFAEYGEFPQVSPLLATAVARIRPFHLHLSRFDYFRQRRYCTMFLRPEAEALVAGVHAKLIEALPEYDETARFPNGFHPHLSIGQFQHGHVQAAQQRLQSEWTPIQFEVVEIALIYRAPETEDRFVVAETFALKRE